MPVLLCWICYAFKTFSVFLFSQEEFIAVFSKDDDFLRLLQGRSQGVGREDLFQLVDYKNIYWDMLENKYFNKNINMKQYFISLFFGSTFYGYNMFTDKDKERQNQANTNKHQS